MIKTNNQVLITGIIYENNNLGVLMRDLIQLKSKNIVVMGVANERSLAWGVAKSLFEVGANVIFTYRKERSLGKIEKLLKDNSLEAKLVVECDVNSDESIKAAFQQIGQEVGVIHGVVHSVAFAHAEDLKGDFCKLREMVLLLPKILVRIHLLLQQEKQRHL